MSVCWNVGRGRLVKPAPFCLVGIVNITPDSFYDGGLYAEPEQAVRRGLELLDQGAHMLDLGAESTRPGALELADTLEQAAGVETARLLPVLEALRRHRPEAVLSVDTCHSLTAAAVLEAGAEVINDVSACGRDPGLLDVLIQYKPGYVLMHGGDKGGYFGLRESAGSGGSGGSGAFDKAVDPGTITDRVLHFFEERLAHLIKSGLPEQHIVLDPGVGFGKTSRESVALLRDTERLQSLGRPLYMGLSMKSLFGDLLGLAVADRGEATRVATAVLAARGVRYHRVHDVSPAARALRLAELFVGL